MTLTRDEAARAFAKAIDHAFTPYVPRLATEPVGHFALLHPPTRRPFEGILPAPDAPLHEKLSFTGRIAEAVFLTEDEVFRCGWVHGVLENCIEDARVKYDVCHAALLAALAAMEAR